MGEAAYFRKKPVVVQAMQLDETHETMLAVREWIGANGGQTTGFTCNPQRGRFYDLSVVTLEGTMRAEPGDWIIRGVKGEFYPCKPDIFDASYEPEPAPSSPSPGSAPSPAPVSDTGEET